MDNRIKFPGPKIDFINEVGITGLDHDNWPGPNEQARYDWMRMYLIGLLSTQSSLEEPTEKRIGTPWFDMSAAQLKYWDGDRWISPATFISVDENLSLQGWYDSVAAVVRSAAPAASFSGYCQAVSADLIPIPPTTFPLIDVGHSRPLVYINGRLLDPRKTTFAGANVRLNAASLVHGDSFTVLVVGITTERFVEHDVIIT